MSNRITLAAALSILMAATPVSASIECAKDAMIVFDGSSSMSEINFDTGDATRIVEARQAIARVLPRVEAFRRIGLLTYGPGGDSSCTGIDLRFGPQTRAAEPVIAEVNALRPDGLTPLTAAVAQAADTLNYRTQPGVIVLVTDGNETCGGRPCTLAAELSAKAADLTVHVIGFRAVVDFFAWNNPEQDPHTSTTVARCLADETGGTFVSTDTVEELVAALQDTLGCALIGNLLALKTHPSPA